MNYVYVDCRHVRSLAPDVDIGRVYTFVGGEQSEIGRAVLYGAPPPDRDSIWEMAKRLRFELKIELCDEASVDSFVMTDILSDSYELLDVNRDEITLVAASHLYLPMLKKLRARGARVKLASWGQASEAMKMASEFVSLDDHVSELRYPAATF
jgi:NYN domain